MAKYKVVFKFKVGQAPENNQIVREKLIDVGFNQQSIEIKLPVITI